MYDVQKDIFKTGNIEIIRECQAFFGFKLPSVLLNISSDKFIRLYDASDNVIFTSLRVKLSIFFFFCFIVFSLHILPIR